MRASFDPADSKGSKERLKGLRRISLAAISFLMPLAPDHPGYFVFHAYARSLATFNSSKPVRRMKIVEPGIRRVNEVTR